MATIPLIPQDGLYKVGSGLLRLVFSSIVVLGFFFAIWTCSAQERLVTAFQVAAPDVKLDFTEMVAIYDKVSSDAQRAQDNAAKQHKLSSSIAAQKASIETTRLQVVQNRSELAAVLSTPGACNSAATAAESDAALLERARLYAQCAKGADHDRTVAAVASFNNSTAQLTTQQGTLAEQGAQLAAIDVLPTTSQNLTKIDPDRLVVMFSELDNIKRTLPFLGSPAMHASPFVLQFALALFAGGLGALLITLIVIVYPGTPNITVTTVNFYPRVVVGGLIAICVYLVLGTGSSFLNAGISGIDASKMNISGMAFITILAGAFSDRAAGWMSRRADIFFSTPPSAPSSTPSSSTLQSHPPSTPPSTPPATPPKGGSG